MQDQLGQSPQKVELLLTDSADMKTMNWHFRKKNKPTDVLSFPSEMNDLLGSIAIDLETAKKQSKDFRHSLQQECVELFIHGVLHLYGFNHEIGPEADFMSYYEKYFVRSFKSDRSSPYKIQKKR
jgi:probable rRNA maturation factor